MPRSGYSREDPVPRRSGYVSYDNNPVDHRGGPESDSGRINLARMDEGGLHGPDGRLYSSTASDLSQIPARDDLYRSDPSREYERRTRGYNSGYFGEHVPSFGSSPQLGGLDRGYRDEGDWPRHSPILTDWYGYKRDTRRAFRQVKEYERDEAKWDKSRDSTAYLPPHLRDEDSYDERQSLLAAEASRSCQRAGEKRAEHNLDYLGHWSREKRRGHLKGVEYCQGRAACYRDESQRHRKSRNDRWRD